MRISTKLFLTLFIISIVPITIAILVDLNSNSDVTMLLAIMGGFCACVIPISLLFSRMITHDIKALKEGAQRISAGDHSHRVDVSSGGEFQETAACLNRLARELMQYRKKTEQFEDNSKALYEERRKYELGKELLKLEVLERERVEAALRESEEKFRGISENSFDMIFTTDEKGFITYASPSVERTLSCKPAEMVGKHVTEYLTQSGISEHSQDLSGMFEGKRVGITEITLRTNNGSEIFAELAGTRIMKDDKVVGLQGIIRDITSRKQAQKDREELYAAIQAQNEQTSAANRRLEEALREVEKTQEDLKNSQTQLLQSDKLAAVGQLVSGVAHELNNPLMAISGNAQLMLEDIKDESLQEKLHTVHDETRRAITIVRDLLSFARKQEPQRTYASVNESLESAIRLREYELNVDNIEVSTKLAPQLPKTMADFHQLQQVFLNLIMNAEHAIKKTHGEGRLIIQTEETDERIRITFTDNGPGIPPHIKDRIFEPFFTTKDVGEGTGLGLSICHGIITEHSGEVFVKSNVGEGTTFTIDLPIISESIECPAEIASVATIAY